MDYALLAATALGGVALYLMLPREKAPLVKLGALLAVLAFGGLFLYLFRALAGSLHGVSAVDPYFYLFAVIMVAGTLGVICQPRPVYAALYFVLVTLAGAGIFVMLLAEFMAIVLIIIYAGAILVTYVFVIMLASQSTSGTGGEASAPLYDREAAEPLAATLISFILLGAVLQCLFPATEGSMVGGAKNSDPRMVRRIGDAGGDVSAARIDRAVSGANLRGIMQSAMVYGAENTTLPVVTTDTVATTAPAQSSVPATEHDAMTAAANATRNRLAATNAAATGSATLPAPRPEDKPLGDTQLLGNTLYGRYALSLELAGILLTIALIGAVVIARKEAPSAVLGTGQVPNE